MTAQELIEALKQFDPDLPIVVDADGPEHGMISVLRSERVRFGYAGRSAWDDRELGGVEGDVDDRNETTVSYFDSEFRQVDGPIEGGHKWRSEPFPCVYLEG